jgi:tetratricopeptide (TPR) repeat protein
LEIKSSKNADALFNLALLEQRRGNHSKYQELLEKARQVLRDEVSAFPNSAIAHFHMAKIYAHEKNWDQATTYLKTAVAIDSEWAFWARYEVFFQEMFKAYPETEKTMEAFADVYAAAYVAEARANKSLL